MKKLSLLFFFFILQTNCFAQELSSIQTDRPDQTECPFITPKKYFQFENGFSYEKTNENSNEIISPTVLTRYGINDNFELRLLTEWVTDKNNFEKNSGFVPVLVGFKTKILEENGVIPTTSFIGHIAIPSWASTKHTTTYYAPEFRFTMQHTINEKQTLSYNLGAEWDGETAAPTFIYTLTTAYSLSENMGAYLECYGFVPQIGKPDHRFDLGLTYLFNPNHQLDVSSGLGLSETSAKYYISLGYSFRFKI